MVQAASRSRARWRCCAGTSEEKKPLRPLQTNVEFYTALCWRRWASPVQASPTSLPLAAWQAGRPCAGAGTDRPPHSPAIALCGGKGGELLSSPIVIDLICVNMADVECTCFGLLLRKMNSASDQHARLRYLGLVPVRLLSAQDPRPGHRHVLRHQMASRSGKEEVSQPFTHSPANPARYPVSGHCA